MTGLEEAVVLAREALALCPPRCPDRSTALNNLAGCLCTRYRQLGGLKDLEEAITLDRDALVLRPPGNPGRSMCLNNLTLHLLTRYEQLGGIKSLEEAIEQPCSSSLHSVQAARGGGEPRRSHPPRPRSVSTLPSRAPKSSYLTLRYEYRKEGLAEADKGGLQSSQLDNEKYKGGVPGPVERFPRRKSEPVFESPLGSDVGQKLPRKKSEMSTKVYQY